MGLMEPTTTPNIALAPYKHVGGPQSAPTGTLESFNPATGELVGSVPRAGESLIVGNFKLVVERVVRRRVERVYLKRLQPVTEDVA